MHPRATLAVVGVILLGSLAGVLLVVRWPVPLFSGLQNPAPPYAAPVAPPMAAASPVKPGIAAMVDAGWLAETSARTHIPKRALAAYAGAALTKATTMPTCGLSWNSLAAIGYVESHNGTAGGSRLDKNGTAEPGIFGVALAGGSTATIPDSDGGAIDGDAENDRAVGPMQLIPQTWRNWHTDASGDGVEDPQNIDDAAMVTANYLCRASGDMVNPAGWRKGIAAYNSAPSYLRLVARVANSYAR
jgi:membrane-bound lytic murein transglycosylase B